MLLLSVLAILASLMMFLLVPLNIRLSKKIATNGQPILEYVDQHKYKSQTPSMGGLSVILVIIVVSNLPLLPGIHPYTLILMLAILLFGCIGLFDDIQKMHKQKNQVLPARVKLIIQVICATVITGVMYHYLPSHFAGLMFFSHYMLPVPVWMYFIFSVILIVASSNSYNLLDGLDGLVSVPSIMTAIFFVVVAYIRFNFPALVLATTIVPTMIAFLWFNTKPAKIFLGDTGSLALGGLFGVLAVMLKSEIGFALVSIPAILESISVIVQVYYFKYTKKRYGEGQRVFLMAPIHHHFEKKGLPEYNIVVRFWILATFALYFAMLWVSFTI
ncbi:MAG: phospho-N-acetylmuramoyl-pentapeptide-transferas e [Candidatus Xenolissoclinum pacificiensis L6]|uniref:Phospho-N-acetylmuramoyl-pentapeptide-transferase n=1 Tax=Candidatus Xenolissoclinum pacificiensis L6 TaxID=1401685 RepID=W2V2A2_9RICK|nr:MAG: phospho-N-acetylmuramoyl-pentapeptide-transferas e [Candidatus Xenolissoclinum pacificiensis L6]